MLNGHLSALSWLSLPGYIEATLVMHRIASGREILLLLVYPGFVVLLVDIWDPGGKESEDRLDQSQQISITRRYWFLLQCHSRAILPQRADNTVSS